MGYTQLNGLNSLSYIENCLSALSNKHYNCGISNAMQQKMYIDFSPQT